MMMMMICKPTSIVNSIYVDFVLNKIMFIYPILLRWCTFFYDI
jgi:hypothetical protein